MNAFHAALFSAFVLIVAAPPVAAESRVLVVIQGEPSSLAQRVMAELVDLGLEPQLMVRGADDAALTGSDIERLATERGAVATVAVDIPPGTLEAWILDQSARGQWHREVISGSPGVIDEAASALGAVELLRARLLVVAPDRSDSRTATEQATSELTDLTTPGQESEEPREETEQAAEPTELSPFAENGPIENDPTEDETDPSEPSSGQREMALDQPSAEHNRRLPRRAVPLVLGVSGAVGWSPGGLGVTGYIPIDIAWEPHRWVGVHLLGLVPVGPGTVSGPEGEASAGVGLIGLGARIRFTSPTNVVGFAVDVGGGPLILDARGRAEPSYVSLSQRTVAAAVYSRLVLAWQPLWWLRVRLETTIGVSLPELFITFVDRDVADWGRPFIVAGLGLEVMPIR